MELKDFIAESIVQICKGLAEAQEQVKDLHVVINVPVITKKDGTLSITNNEFDRVPQLVDFDICVTAENTKESNAKGKINVLAFGMDGDFSVQKSDTAVSRIKFSVPTLFPTDFTYYYDDLKYKDKIQKGFKE